MSDTHATGTPAEGHVDLDAVKAIVTGVTPLHEIRVAWALTISPDLKGLRAIERASGLSRESVLKVLPASGESTDLLECPDRGQFAWDLEDRRSMVVRQRSSADHTSSPSTENLNYVQEVGTPGRSVGEEDQNRDGQQMTGIGDLLDPALDIWANTGGDRAYGDAGWALAMVTGLRPMTFSLDELRTITRLAERQLRRFLKKLGSFVTREKTGRTVAVTVDFSWMAHEDLVQDYSGRAREAHKAREHTLEAEAVQSMGTERGRTVREMVRNAKAELAMLRDWALMTGSRAWDNLIWILEGHLRPRTDLNRIGRWSAEHLISKDLGPVRA